MKEKKLTDMVCSVYTLLDLIYLVVYKQCNACQGTLLGLEVIVLFKNHSWLEFKVRRSNLLNNQMQPKLNITLFLCCHLSNLVVNDQQGLVFIWYYWTQGCCLPCVDALKTQLIGMQNVTWVWEKFEILTH